MTDYRHVILLAHGSRDPRWRAPFEKLCCEVQEEAGANRVSLAYMEFVPPTLLDAARAGLNNGVTSISVVPLFMSAGAHIADDVPKQIAEVRAECPQLNIELLPPVGEDPRLQQLLRTMALEAIGADR